MRFVFLSEGGLFLKEDSRDAVEIESHSDGLRVWLDGQPRRKVHEGHIVQSVVFA